MSIGFDNDKYLEEQGRYIIERSSKNAERLYLEFGGKIMGDYHAARVLPGFDPDVKMKLLHSMRDKVEIIFCIYSGDIEQKKVRADMGLSYDDETLRTIDSFRSYDLSVTSVVITRFNGQPLSTSFISKLEHRGIKVYTHRSIPGYPFDVDKVVCDEGMGSNPYIETTKPIVVVTAPGPNSGKLATCLNQVYHEKNRGVHAVYAKFETFPVWNLPVEHPVNLAYEAATADLLDVNLIDPFHLEAYGIEATNYNRDIDSFPIISRLFERLQDPTYVYKSPTDMGVNRVGFAIIDDTVVCEASKQEIVRRFFMYKCAAVVGQVGEEAIKAVSDLMTRLNLSELDRFVVRYARESAETAATVEGKGCDGIFAGAAIQLHDGSIIIGRNSSMFHAASACVLNAIKKLANLPEELLVLVPDVLGSVGNLKKDIFSGKSISLDLLETLIILSVSAPMNPSAKLAMQMLQKLKGCEMHLSHLPTPGDEKALRRLGIRFTSDPIFSSRNLLSDD